MDRETLEQYRKNRKEILQLREEIEALQSKLSAPSTANYSGMPGGRGGAGDPVGNGVAALDALCTRYRKKLAELCAEQEEIENAIDGLDKELRTIMRYRYIAGYKWETICSLMGSEKYGPMDWMAVHRRHRKALAILGGKPYEEL